MKSETKPSLTRQKRVVLRFASTVASPSYMLSRAWHKLHIFLRLALHEITFLSLRFEDVLLNDN